MLIWLKTLSLKRGSWLLLFLSTLALEMTALYFQYGMGLQPCVMCIYERVALAGIMFAALIGFLQPKFIIIRLIALFIGLGSTVKGLLLALKHVDYQTNPHPLNQCTYLPEFPQSLPLDQWLPALFQPTGSCSEISWQFLGVTMAQWIVVIFAFYSLLFVLLLISQCKPLRSNRYLFH